jgi:hypothetical protein
MLHAPTILTTCEYNVSQPQLQYKPSNNSLDPAISLQVAIWHVATQFNPAVTVRPGLHLLLLAPAQQLCWPQSHQTGCHHRQLLLLLLQQQTLQHLCWYLLLLCCLLLLG